MNIKQKMCPQMKTYDDIGYDWLPYVMYSQTKNFRSKVCNTDTYGLRFNDSKEIEINKFNSIFDNKNLNSKNNCALVGNSTSFSVGCSEDKFSLSNLLSKDSNNYFYNLSGRAFNGFQELILYQSLIDKLKNIKTIILLTGIFDIYSVNFYEKYQQNLGPFYFSEKYLRLMKYGEATILRRLANIFLRPFFSKNIDWGKITKKNLLKYILNKDYKNSYVSNQNNLTKEEFLKNTISRNLKLWSIIAQRNGTELHFFLQPFLDYCKELSNEEKDICEYIENSKKDRKSYVNRINIVHQNFSTYKEIIKKCCEEMNIKFHDCNEFFKQNTTKSDWIFVDRVHLNDNGYKLLSEFIKSKL